MDAVQTDEAKDQGYVVSAINLQQVSKAYHLYNRPIERLTEMLTGKPAHVTIQALQLIDINIPKGQVLGLIGNNGAEID